MPLAGGAPVPILPDVTAVALFSPDRTMAIAPNPDDTFMIHTVAGGPARRLPGMTDADEPFAFSDDGRSVFVQRGQTIPLVVERIDLQTGKRTPVGEFSPVSRAGLVHVYFGSPVVKADFSQYAYGYVRRPSVFFID